MAKFWYSTIKRSGLRKHKGETYLLLRVSKSDIRRGERGDGEGCAIARRLKKALVSLGCPKCVKVAVDETSIAAWKQTCKDNAACTSLQVNGDGGEHACNFITRFDDGKSVRPTTIAFKLENIDIYALKQLVKKSKRVGILK